MYKSVSYATNKKSMFALSSLIQVRNITETRDINSVPDLFIDSVFN